MKRYIILVHRWTGVGMCLLLAAWFASGIVMLFVGYPKLTPWERLGALPTLPALPAQGCCIGPDAALRRSRVPADVTGITLSSIGGRPAYVLREGAGKPTVVDAATGAVPAAVGSAAAIAAARTFGHGAPAEYEGMVNEDRWTHSGSLNAHRPLHVVQLHDAATTRVYVSSTTGQVMLDAPRAERWWNVVGAWLHWLYMVRNQPRDPVWTWTVIVISSIGVISAVTGIVNGLVRWRFAGRYKNGTRTPFRESWMRWHHLFGLTFGALLCTWIFSGLMSMNPVGVFDAQGARPDARALAGGSPAQLRPALAVGDILGRLQAEGFGAVELEWRVLDGQPYVLARDGRNATRLMTAAGAVLQRWPEAQLLRAAAHLLPAPVVSTEVLTHYDRYYYARGEASMYGSDERRLPALRVAFDDPGETWVYLDVHTGQVALDADASQRTGRWLFNLLHSWDLPVMLDAGWARDAAIIAFSLGGLLLSVTGSVIAVRRMRHALPTTQ